MTVPLPAEPGPLELRRGVLAVSVLHDLDVEPGELGVVLPGPPRVHVPWTECRRAVAGWDPEGGRGRQRLTRWLQARRWAADLGRDALLPRLRPAGLPVGHLLHPGLDWVCERVLGDALDLGLGAVGMDPNRPDEVVLLPRTALDAARLDLEQVWPPARALLEELGALAAALLARDAKGLLRPVGDCDVVTLLGARSLRAALATVDSGMASAVVPMRRRGWTRLSLIDPAFGPAAAAATAAADRGFARPLLLTADEVIEVAERHRPETLALRQPANAAAPWGRDVLRQ